MDKNSKYKHIKTKLHLFWSKKKNIGISSMMSIVIMRN
jgi:hypothetical protein